MQIFSKLNKNENLVLALGFFDGVHLGHKKVIKSAVEYAKQDNLKTAVITFQDHPCCHFLGICPKYISQNREDKLAQLGIDFLYILNFEEIATLTAEEYLSDILVKNFTPDSIFTGFNHTFGANRMGNSKFLADNQIKYGYKYYEIQPQKTDNQIISSSKIRKALAEGDIELANNMLGENFSITSTVVEGQKLGRTLGYKTANQIYPAKLIDIPFGVYEVETIYGKGIANFGIRPTINKCKEPVLETHILNFDKDIYNTELKVNFIKMIRKEEKFNSLAELKSQIEKDIQKINL